MFIIPLIYSVIACNKCTQLKKQIELESAKIYPAPNYARIAADKEELKKLQAQHAKEDKSSSAINYAPLISVGLQGATAAMEFIAPALINKWGNSDRNALDDTMNKRENERLEKTDNRKYNLANIQNEHSILTMQIKTLQALYKEKYSYYEQMSSELIDLVQKAQNAQEPLRTHLMTEYNRLIQHRDSIYQDMAKISQDIAQANDKIINIYQPQTNEEIAPKENEQSQNNKIQNKSWWNLF